MLRKILTLAFSLALALFASAWLSGAAQAGAPSVCGDGNIEGEETCDDSNTVTGDGCSFPSCKAEVCGDTIVNPDPPSEEECDDGNTVDDDGCTAGTTPNCQFDCGDGEVDATATPAEVCDDGNETNGDNCDDDPSTDPPGNCTATACGNGVVTAPEECDDGNVVDGDGCSATCTEEAPVGELPKGQQGCVNAVNKNLAGVEKAQSGDNAKCVKDIAAEKTNVADCIGQDVKGKVAKAGEKTTKTIGKKCVGENVPPFAFTDAATVNGTNAEVQEAFTVVFGATPAIAVKSAEKEDAACQAEVLKQHNAVLNKYASEANKAKKTALKDGADSATALATAIDTAIAASTKLAKAESKANTGIAKKCTDITGLFDCNAAADANALTLCVIAAAKEAACNALEVADGLALTCPSDLIP